MFTGFLEEEDSSGKPLGVAPSASKLGPLSPSFALLWLLQRTCRTGPPAPVSCVPSALQSPGPTARAQPGRVAPVRAGDSARARLGPVSSSGPPAGRRDRFPPRELRSVETALFPSPACLRRYFGRP